MAGQLLSKLFARLLKSQKVKTECWRMTDRKLLFSDEQIDQEFNENPYQ